MNFFTIFNILSMYLYMVCMVYHHGSRFAVWCVVVHHGSGAVVMSPQRR